MKPWIPLVASGLLLSYGAVSTWSEQTYRDNAHAPSWCKRWLLDGEKLAQRAYPLQWEGEAGRAAAVADFQLILARDSASARRWRRSESACAMRPCVRPPWKIGMLTDPARL